MRKTGVALIVIAMLFGSMFSAFGQTHTVKPGDELWKIAKDNGTTVEALVELNNVKNPDLIYPGQVIQISGIKGAMKEASEMTNAQKAKSLIESLGTENTQPVSYINPNKYIQHNLAVADGLEGFGEVVKILPDTTSASVKRVFSDGDFVFMHTEYDFFGPKIGFDIFRFEEGLIVEHWDNLTTTAADVNPAGRSEIDGTTVVRDLEKTEENKTIVKGFVQDVLMGGAPGKITEYINVDKYFQHNAHVADGLDGLGKALEEMAKTGTPMVYDANHFVLGEGNFVLTVSEGQFLGKHVSFYDLFRLEEGQIVEHWDVIEEIPAEKEWKNNNGKF